MIILNSVSKAIGKHGFKRTILQDVSWLIKPRARIAIIGHPHSGAPALLGIIAGTTLPTSGWVDRRAKVSVPGGLLRYAMRDTTRQLISRLSRLYRVDASEVSEFVLEGLGGQNVLDVSPRSLPQKVKQELNTVLTYAFPCDFYLFNNASVGASDPKVQAFCERALELRSKRAGIIIKVSSGRVARQLDPDMMGAVVYRSNLTLYKQLSDAITVFESLPPEEAETSGDDFADEQTSRSEDEEFLL